MKKETDEKKRIIKRLAIARGHLNKVKKMVEENAYCIDVIHQSQAVQAAIRSVDALILNSHLNNCVVSQIKKGNSKTVINEIMNILDKGTK